MASAIAEDFASGRQSKYRTAAYRAMYAARFHHVPMLTSAELAERWRITPAQLGTLRRGRHGPPFVKLGAKTMRYPLPWIEGFEIMGSPPVYTSWVDSSIIRAPLSRAQLAFERGVYDLEWYRRPSREIFGEPSIPPSEWCRHPGGMAGALADVAAREEREAAKQAA